MRLLLLVLVLSCVGLVVPQLNVLAASVWLSAGRHRVERVCNGLAVA